MRTLFFISICLLFACHQSKTNEQLQQKLSKAKPMEKQYQPLDSTITLEVAGHLVDIFVPEKEPIGLILILPGWTFPRYDWCDKSSLCDKALEKGYILVAPEMGKSVYQNQIYPETRFDWKNEPSKPWVTDSLIPYLQNTYGIFLAEQRNFIIGLSTGARGVALLALAQPELYTACAALSGDYEQTQMPQDNLMRGFYGEYALFPDRWEGEDNVVLNIDKFVTPIYIGHGTNDDISPFEQSKLFYEALHKAHPDLKIIFNDPAMGHDYVYWDSEVDAMLAFFEGF